MSVLEPVIEYLNGSPFFFDMGIALLLFAVPLARRKRFSLRLEGVVVLYFLLAQIEYRETLFYLLFIVAAAVLVCIPCDVPWQDALFCVTCAYAVEHAATAIDGYLYRVYMSQFAVPHALWRYLIIFPLIYLAAYFLAARSLPAPETGTYSLSVPYSLITAVLLVVPAVFLSDFCGRHFADNPDLTVCMLYDTLYCGLFLCLQVLQSRRIREQVEFHIQNQLLRQSKEQLQMSGQSIDLINRRCHDLKYRIESLRSKGDAGAWDQELREVSHAVQIYNAVVDTGNETLDTILSERGLYCEAKQIVLTCVVDGSLFQFMDATDLYCLFGNALDNAIEYVSTLDDPEKRLISVSVWQKGGLVLAQVENYCEEQLTLRDGLPATTKPDPENHGFGTRSIRFIAEKYNGCMEIESRPPQFVLTLSFPTCR